MSSIKRFALPLAAACITMVAFLAGTTSAYALSLPGITPSGVPVFMNNVKVRLNKNGGLRAFSNGQGKTFSFFDGSSLRTGLGYLICAQMSTRMATSRAAQYRSKVRVPISVFRIPATWSLL